MRHLDTFFNELEKISKKRELYPDVDEGIDEIREKVHPRAELVGSNYLGINIPGAKDIDVTIPYESRKEYLADVIRFFEKYNLDPSEHNVVRKNRAILRGKGVDLALITGPTSQGFLQAMRDAKKKLDEKPEEKAKIIALKKMVKDMPGNSKEEQKLYYYLKKLIATRLGIKKHWD